MVRNRHPANPRAIGVRKNAGKKTALRTEAFIS